MFLRVYIHFSHSLFSVCPEGPNILFKKKGLLTVGFIKQWLEHVENWALIIDKGNLAQQFPSAKSVLV